MVSALLSDAAIRVRALAQVNALFSWAGHLTLIMSFFARVYKWIQTTLRLGGRGEGGGCNPAMDIQGEKRKKMVIFV